MSITASIGHPADGMTIGVRGSGRTTRQMKAAPQGALFVWCNHHLDAARGIAQTAGRTDLQIVSPTYLDDQRWMGREFTGLVVDHAAELTVSQLESWARLHAYIRSRKEPAHGTR